MGQQQQHDGSPFTGTHLFSSANFEQPVLEFPVNKYEAGNNSIIKDIGHSMTAPVYLILKSSIHKPF